MKFTKITVLALITIITVTAASGFAVLYLSQASTSGTVQGKGLRQPVHIRFDALQRAFVEAGTLPDALFAEGFLHASHRLWQMETLRRAGRGRLAELLGEDALATDRELWRLGVPGLARRLGDNASPRLSTGIQAYVDGVNTALAEYTLLPPEFLLLRHEPEPWTAEDVYAVGAMTAYQSSNNLKNELLRLALLDQLSGEQFSVFLDDYNERKDFPFVTPTPGTGTGALAALQRLSATDSNQNPLMPRLAFGSNGWVVAPQKSQSGRALFAFDSHDRLGLPNLFYEVHLFFDGERQLRGWSIPGLPGVINGFNERIAWGFTNIGDTQDLFLEHICDEGAGGFLDGDLCRPATVKTVEIPVRGRLQAERMQIRHSHNGPLISEQPPIALAWTAHRIGNRGLDALFDLNLAQDPAAIRRALDHWAVPSLNATWADVEGNIGFRTAGLLPVRGAGQGLFPLRGDRPEYHWQGFVAAKDMPRQVNPPRNYVAAANARVNPATVYPLVSADNASPYRVQRLHDVLGREQTFAVEDMRRLQMDRTDGQALQLLPELLPYLTGQALSPAAVEALKLLQSWQAQPLANRDSAAALIFQTWYLEIARSVFEPSLGTDLFQQLLQQADLLNHALDSLILTQRHSDAWPEMRTEFRGLVLADALETSLGDLQSVLGGKPDQWRLDNMQQVFLEHELARTIPALGILLSRKPEPWGGSTATVGRARYRYQELFRVTTAATVRAVVEMDRPPRMASVIPGGQSGHPLSPHYTDQFDAWLEGCLYPIASRPENVGPATLHLLPAVADPH